eukprot:SAG22_NODE_3048_length_1984_cov_1.699204_1_plen_520_part_10
MALQLLGLYLASSSHREAHQRSPGASWIGSLDDVSPPGASHRGPHQGSPGASRIAAAAAAPSITGSLDGVSPPGAASSAVGWAKDSRNLSAPVLVRFFLNAAPPAPHSVLLGECATFTPRPDLGIPGLHGFSFPIPDEYLDKRNHTVLAFGVDGQRLVPLDLSGAAKTDTFSCGLVTCPSLPVNSSDASGVRMRAVGSAEYVFRHSVEGCEFGDGADSPARAFRDADGSVVLTSANAGATYRRVGKTLGSVKSECASGPVMGYGNSSDYFKLEDLEWPTAPYSVDGSRVYVLVHNEWHHPEVIDPKQCTPGSAWVNGITIAASSDGGRSFVHPADYRVRIPPPWQPGFPCNQTLCAKTGCSQFGSFEPSNIVHNQADDGRYYATFNYISHPVPPFTSGRGPIVGDCLMRTHDLSAGGSSWQVWTANTTQPSQPAATTDNCRVISDGANTNDGALDIKSLSYHTYLRRWIGIGDRNGLYGFALSPDLKVWSAFVPFLAHGVPQGPSAYISLLDPADTSQTF